jgi:hypothetical protein
MALPVPIKVPPSSERGFRRKWNLIWVAAGAGSMITGLAIGPRLNHSRNPWISIVVACAVYVVSLLLAPLTLMAVWRRPFVSPAVLFFSVPVGSFCIVAMLLMKRFASALLFPDRELLGLALGMGLLYAAALIWGIAVGIQRKKMGDILIRPRL